VVGWLVGWLNKPRVSTLFSLLILFQIRSQEFTDPNNNKSELFALQVLYNFVKNVCFRVSYVLTILTTVV